jgi:hypothetical protein
MPTPWLPLLLLHRVLPLLLLVVVVVALNGVHSLTVESLEPDANLQPGDQPSS